LCNCNQPVNSERPKPIPTFHVPLHGYQKGPRFLGEELAGTMVTEEDSSRKVPSVA
jgi:hypothetical protein